MRDDGGFFENRHRIEQSANIEIRLRSLRNSSCRTHGIEISMHRAYMDLKEEWT